MTLIAENYLNLTEFLLGEKTQDPMKLYCLDIIDYQTKVRPDLRKSSFLDGYKLFIDGSSKMIQGKRNNGYSVVDGEKLKVVESGRLPNNWSAQTCELFAFNQALKFLKDKGGTIYRDSKCALGSHTPLGRYGERGLINKELIVKLLENLMQKLQ
jgi:hypothetical protein